MWEPGSEEPYLEVTVSIKMPAPTLLKEPTDWIGRQMSGLSLADRALDMAFMRDGASGCAGPRTGQYM